MSGRYAIIMGLAVWLMGGGAAADEFRGYPCRKDCSGHKAGYEWAIKKEIAVREDCGGKSQSFREGCYAWVEERSASAQERKPQKQRVSVNE